MKKRLAVIAAGLAVVATLGLTGCSGTTTSTPSSPIAVGTNHYASEYVGVGKGEAVKCLWYYKHAQSGSMSCDWSKLVDTESLNETFIPVGQKHYSFDYIAGKNSTSIRCLWYYKHAQSGSMSCDFEHPIDADAPDTGF